MSLVGDELALECKKLLRLERALYSGRTMMSFSFCRRSVSRRPLFVDRKRDVLLCRLPRWSRCRFIVLLESIIVKQMRMYQRYWELEVRYATRKCVDWIEILQLMYFWYESVDDVDEYR
jgi:hypothetical protein